MAASVGLPYPLSTPRTQERGSDEWQSSERLSQANLDGITFPGIQQVSVGSGEESNISGVEREKQSRHSLSDATLLQDTAKHTYRGRASSLEIRGGLSEENVKPVSPVTPTSPKRKGSGSSTSSPLPFSHPTVHLSSLRISETSLFGSVSQQQPPKTSTGTPLEDYDEVFLQNPAPPPSPPFSPPIRETNITEDFPPPPPPVELELEAKEETVGRFVLQYLCVLFEMSLLLF